MSILTEGTVQYFSSYKNTQSYVHNYLHSFILQNKYHWNLQPFREQPLDIGEGGAGVFLNNLLSAWGEQII